MYVRVLILLDESYVLLAVHYTHSLWNAKLETVFQTLECLTEQQNSSS